MRPSIVGLPSGEDQPSSGIRHRVGEFLPRLSMGGALVLLLAAIVLLTGTTILLFGYQLSKQEVLPLERRRLEDSLAITQRQFAAQLESCKRDVIALSSVPPLEALIAIERTDKPFDGGSTEVWQRRLTTIFTGTLIANPEYSQVRFIGFRNNGREITRVDRSSDGEIVITPEGALQEKENRDYFREVLSLAPGELFVSRFELNRERGILETPYRPTVRMATPVYLDDVDPVGFVIINVDLSEWLEAIVASAPQASRYLLTNSKGDYLAHPDSTKAFGFDLGNRFRLTDEFPEVADIYHVDSPARQFSVLDETVVSVYRAPLVDCVQDPFVVFCAVSDREVALAHTIRLRNWGVMVTVLMVVVAIGIAVFSAQFLVRPLTQLCQTADKVSNGELDLRVPVSRASIIELSELAKSFNGMLDFLNATLVSRDALEKEVEQRTLAEENLRAKSNELENRNQELADEQAALIAANQSLEQFAYAASHDLRSPMRGMSALAEFVIEDAGGILPQESKGHLDEIQRRVAAMNRMLDSLLEFARSTPGSKEATDVDVRSMLQEIVDTLDVPEQMTIEFPNDSPQIKTHYSPLSQVFRNLIDNAIKYRENDRGTISIEAARVGEKYHFVVADDGPGIDPIHHHKVFNIFQTLPGKKADAGMGIGMGLALVQRIVVAHGGTITLQSEVGRGAKFEFTWPVEPERSKAAAGR